MRKLVLALLVSLLLIFTFPGIAPATVSVETVKNVYTSTGTTGPFPYGFKIYAASDLAVVSTDLQGTETPLVCSIDYSVTGIGDDTGGSITLTSALPSGYTLTIIRDMAYLQSQKYVSNGSFTAKSLNDALDKLSLQIQQVKEEADRGLQLPRSSSLGPLYIAPSANTLLGWDASGTRLKNYPAGTATIPQIDRIENYGNDLAGAVSTIGSGIQDLWVDTWITLPGDVTIPETLNLIVTKSGKIILNGHSLTFAAKWEHGRTQAFEGSGVVFAAGQVVYPEWWGSGADALGYAAVSIASAGGVVKPGVGTYTAPDLGVPLGVSIEADGLPAMTNLSFTAGGIYGTGSSGWYMQNFKNFTITHASASGSNLEMLDARLGANSCNFENLEFVGKSGATKDGLVIRGVNPDTSTANNLQYNNRIVNCRWNADGLVTGYGLYFFGQNIDQGRVNSNYCQRLVFGRSGNTDNPHGWSTHVFIRGGLNQFDNCTFNPASVTGIRMVSSGVNETQNNLIIGTRFDSTWTVPKVILVNEADVYNHFFEAYSTNLDPSEVSLAGSYSAKANFNTQFENGSFIASAGSRSTLTPSGGAFYGAVYDNGAVSYGGGYNALGGRLIVSGYTFDTSTQAVGKYGSLSLAIQNITGASIRHVVTTDGSSFTKIFEQLPSGAIQSLPTSNGPVGTFTWGSTGTTCTVSNTAVTSSSIIMVFPTTANAAALLPYVSAKSAGASFTLTKSAGTPTSSDAFSYLILN